LGPTQRLAVDLGTCHTVAVVRRGSDAPRSLLFDGSPLLPSGVYAEPSGSILIGRDAERMSQIDPGRYEPSPKRRIDEGSVLLGDTETPVIELLAAILRRVAAEAQQSGVNPAGATVLTCPADWGKQRRNLLLAAAQRAGLGPVDLVDEPIAAAAYCQGVLGQQIPTGRCLAVFDFGGGTLDVTVVRRDPGGLAVMGVGGLDDLGGVDCDAALVGHIGQLISYRNPQVWQRLSQPTRPAEQRDRRTLWAEVRSAKEMLSRTTSAPIQVPGTEEALHLTREELDRVVGPLIDRAVDETRRVFQRAGVEGHQLAGIFLVGGSSRIPLVSNRLHTRFGLAPTVPEQPELPVAMGALLAASGLAAAAAAAGRGGAPARGTASRGGSGGAVAPVSGYPTGPTSGGFAAGPSSGAGSYAPAPSSGGGSYPPVPGSGGGSYPPAPNSPPVPLSSSFPPVPVVSGHGMGGRPPGPPPAPPGPIRTPGPPPAPPGPNGPWSPPPAGRPQPRRRRGVFRYVALATVVGLVALCGFGVRAVYRAVSGAGGALSDAARAGVDGYGSVDLGKLDELTGGQRIPVAGNGAVGVVAGNNVAYYAVGGSGSTQVYAVAPDGTQRWQTSIKAEPAEIRLTIVGDLLILDGERAHTHDGNDIRAVIDTRNPKTPKWVKEWGDRLDAAYLGTDAIVENTGSSIKTDTSRVDLLTGNEKWKHAGPSTLYLIQSRRVRPAYLWPEAGRSAAISGPEREAFEFRESLVADPSIVVELDDGSGKGAVIDTGSGKAKVTGTLELEDDTWTVYGGQVIGKLAGQDNKLRAYSTAKLARTWEYEAPGESIDAVAPCGPQAVCVMVSTPGGSTLAAVDVTNGTAIWSRDFESSADPHWYVLGTELFVTEGTDDDAGPVVLDPANGKDKRSFGGSTVQVNGATDGMAQIIVPKVNTGRGEVTWQVAAGQPASGKVSGAVSVGEQLPSAASVSSNTLIAFSSDRKVLVYPVKTG